eukprot:jgi/Botrbrau1/16755/Bobra.0269s0002.1
MKAAPDLFPVPHETADSLIPRGLSTTDKGKDVGDEAPPALPITADEIWTVLRQEAEEVAEEEPLLSGFMHIMVLSQPSLLRTLAHVLIARIQRSSAPDAGMHPEVDADSMASVLEPHMPAIAADIHAVRARDPSSRSYQNAVLHHGGFHALALHRAGHSWWRQGHLQLAFFMQNIISCTLGADLHPAAKFGKGILLQHPLGVVIGEAAVVGNNVTINHYVTLGGTGNEDGDRHPKVGDYAQIGARATILGNIRIGQHARVASGSLVLKPVPDGTLVAGSPARELGQVANLGAWVL